MPALRAVRHYLSLSALALLISGCGATHQSTTVPAIEQASLQPRSIPFTRLPPQRFTPAGWPQALEAQVLLPTTPGLNGVPLRWWFTAAAGVIAAQRIWKASRNN